MSVTQTINQRLASSQEQAEDAQARYVELVVSAARDDVLPEGTDDIVAAAGKTLEMLRADVERVRPVYIALQPVPPEVLELKRQWRDLRARIDAKRENLRCEASRRDTDHFMRGGSGIADLSDLQPMRDEIAELEKQCAALEIPPDPPGRAEGEALVSRLRAQIDATMTPRWHDAKRELQRLDSQISKLRRAAEGEEINLSTQRHILEKLAWEPNELRKAYGAGPGMRTYQTVRLDKATCQRYIAELNGKLAELKDSAYRDTWTRQLWEWESRLRPILAAEAKLLELTEQRLAPLQIMADEGAKVEKRKSDGDYLARLTLEP